MADPTLQETAGEWTIEDALRAVYGDADTPFDWERAIIEALVGKVALDTALKVIEAAHQAYRDGGSDAHYE
jgi:hypothetical protein